MFKTRRTVTVPPEVPSRKTSVQDEKREVSSKGNVVPNYLKPTASSINNIFAKHNYNVHKQKLVKK